MRQSATDTPHVELFCPVPQMVGGGTVHWQGWLPRFTPGDFRLRSIVGDVSGASLADWPISYEELEPFYAKVEWAFGVDRRQRYLYDEYAVQEAGLERRSTITHPRVEPHDLASFGAALV